MRIAFYHNLPHGGALRNVGEMLRRARVEHECHVYRVIGTPSQASDGATDHEGVAVHDIPLRQAWAALGRRMNSARLPIELVSLWGAEKEIAKRVDAGSYDLCFVNPCRVTQSPSLLYRLHTPTLYFAHETRRMTFEAPVRAAHNRSVLIVLPP